MTLTSGTALWLARLVDRVVKGVSMSILSALPVSALASSTISFEFDVESALGVAFLLLFSVGGCGSPVGDLRFLSRPSDINGCANIEWESGLWTPRETGNRSLTSRGAELRGLEALPSGDCGDCGSKLLSMQVRQRHFSVSFSSFMALLSLAHCWCEWSPQTEQVRYGSKSSLGSSSSPFLQKTQLLRSTAASSSSLPLDA